MTKQPVYLEHYVFDNERTEGVHTAYSDTFEVTDEQLALMELIVYTRDHTSDYSTRLNAKRAIIHMYENYDSLAPHLFDADEEPIEKHELCNMTRYDIEYVLETAQINVPCQFDHYDNADGSIHMYQPTGVVHIHKGYSPHELTNSEKKLSLLDGYYSDMLEAFEQGVRDFHTNVSNLFPHGTPTNGAWAAGYAKAQKESKQ